MGKLLILISNYVLYVNSDDDGSKTKYIYIFFLFVSF